MVGTPAILVTGGTGKVGSRIARHLKKNGFPARIASRRQPSSNYNGLTEHAYFDWSDETTYAPVLTGIQRLFLVAPIGVADPSMQILTFLEHALRSGVRRVVLLSSSLITADSPGLGPVHKAIQEQLPEWAVLRPSWFMQNFVEDHFHAASIKNEGIIVTATGEGRVGFVDVEDIAEVGFHALIDEPPHNTDHIITGPQALSYAEAANILSTAFRRTIRHISASPEEVQARMVASGIPTNFAAVLTHLDYEGIRNGLEDRVTPTVERITGHVPRSLADFATAYAALNVPATHK
ncbi:putative oxidoreductase YesF [Reticulibacter mediterranei]|uniref:Putative oxidoreductase YesF n=1 Tax=Reticulibacter mediterranei TaxID=2778369 RepID=A0A8J3N1X9_9CHLR|nr:NAD-dependent epimerase/dehydratase family protein [Reticulibacter mediterranei]GHO93008.1 putative oxidoreductase YesF [Reticulibacter mediterranei]